MDRRLRILERTATQDGDPAARKALLVERRRVGIISDAQLLLAAWCHPSDAYKGGYLPWEILGWKNGHQCRNYASVIGNAEKHFKPHVLFDPKIGGTSMGSPHYPWCPARLGYRYPNPAADMENWCQGIPKIAADIPHPLDEESVSASQWWAIKAGLVVFKMVHAQNHGDYHGLKGDVCIDEPHCPYSQLERLAEAWLKSGLPVGPIGFAFPEWAYGFEAMLVLWEAGSYEKDNGVYAMRVLFEHAGGDLHAPRIRDAIHKEFAALLLGDA